MVIRELTQTSLLQVSDLYRGFESFPLRTHLTAEKIYPPAEIRINARIYRLFADKPDCNRTDCSARSGMGSRLFSGPQQQSDLSSSMRRTPGDHKPMIRRAD